MGKTTAIDEQIETIEMVMAAEELRNCGLVGRGDISQAEADAATARLQAIKDTLEYLRDNRADFMEFRKAQKVQAR